MTKNDRKKLFEDAKVAAALHKLATEGYSSTEQAAYKDDDGIVRLVTVERHFPPSVEAQVFWLCNRRPEQWKIDDVTMSHIFGKVQDQLDDYARNRTH